MKRAFFTSAGKLLAALIAMLVLSGCVTSVCQFSAPEKGMKSRKGHEVVATLTGLNTGVFLFNVIPVWSGKPHRPNRMDYEFFEDLVDANGMRRMFDKKAKLLKADGVEDFSYTESSSGVWTLWIFWKRAIRAEAVAVKYPAKAKKKKR